MELEELEALARDMGAHVRYMEILCGLFLAPAARRPAALPDSLRGVPVILLPVTATRERLTLTLAHELGHLAMGHGTGTGARKPRILEEIEAWHWAKQALGGRARGEARRGSGETGLDLALDHQYCLIAQLSNQGDGGGASSGLFPGSGRRPGAPPSL